ncbi:hypothetical protein [Stenomitos frigidus]|uniref:Uncharacterized protein n=1 Tax=Stenomitos frigidus ULC18 TaxID=2107698 RepID=A0A2T1DTH1_9CYAN|nr:hypothetical protein [Stenomitos frigidus]PSB23772.1 hypothetical protein C7B82_30030 [Stenomitos frigidus ULC18]
MEPVTVLTAGAIAKIAFEEFAKAGGGELAKKSVGGAIDLMKTLRDKIQAKFQGNAKAETAIAAVETENSEAALTKLEVYLDDAMTDDPEFATQIRQVAQQIVNIQNQSVSTRDYTNYGRDQINIETIQGNPKIGGS